MLRISITTLISLFLLFSPTSVYAQQFKSVIDAISIKSKDSYTNPDWDAAKKIRGIKWKWPYYESSAHNSTMVGETKVGHDDNPHRGYTTVPVNRFKEQRALRALD